MALKIEYINQEAPSPKVAVDQRLYRTADGTRLVPEGHPDAAFLFCTPGHEVSREEFERFELDPILEAASAPEAAAEEESDQGEPEGSAEGQADDAEAAAEPGEQPEGEEKAVEGPAETKEVRKRRTKKAKG